MSKLTIWLADAVAREEYAWRKRPLVTMAIATAFLVAGLILVAFDISRGPGSFFLLLFLLDVGIWLTRVRGKPKHNLRAPDPYWLSGQYPWWWWTSMVFLTFMAAFG